MEIRWKKQPIDNDYVAANSYLSLIFPWDEVSKRVKGLREAIVVEFLAKDIFRASGLPLLGISNIRIRKDKKKIKEGKKLSPILLIRCPNLGKVVIADGYHRMCALYYYDECVWIKCKIV